MLFCQAFFNIFVKKLLNFIYHTKKRPKNQAKEGASGGCNGLKMKKRRTKARVRSVGAACVGV